MNHLPFYKTGLAIAILNALAIINSTKYFLFNAGFSVPAWLAFNVCAPSVMLYLAGFFSKKRSIMATSLPFLLFFGVGGFFVFGWSGYALFAQIGHIFMASAAVYTITVIMIEKKWKHAIYGFIAGLLVFAIILPLQQHYVNLHPDLFSKTTGSEYNRN
jgi:hypothetical protein